uniref:Uncharacterized protein n=1 Tax=Photinus pyralis TaxID=7054 RepID=A0A1Y1MRR2_PHOPY
MNNRQPYQSRYNPHQNCCSGPDNCNTSTPYTERRVIYRRIIRTTVTEYDDTDSEESAEYEEAEPNDLSPEANGPVLQTQATTASAGQQTSKGTMENSNVDVASGVSKDQPHRVRMEDQAEIRAEVRATQTKNDSTTQSDTSKAPTKETADAPTNGREEQYSLPTEGQAKMEAHVQEAEPKNYSTPQPNPPEQPKKDVADTPINDAERQFHSFPIEDQTDTQNLPLGRNSPATNESTSLKNQAPIATSTPQTISCDNNNCPALGCEESTSADITNDPIPYNRNRPGTSKQNERPGPKSVKQDPARPNVYHTTSIPNTSQRFANEPVCHSRGPIRTEQIRTSPSGSIIIRRVQTITTITSTRRY